jgi:ubiquinone/menaquinone biosynthesis C-methylase UbiE
MEMSDEKKKALVKKHYGRIAEKSRTENSCCGPSLKETVPTCGCAGSNSSLVSKAIGYTTVELASLPKEANLGLGCGNPTALASLKEGEAVLDLGSGAGIDCFLAAQKVGRTGKVIGIDMTPSMVQKAIENAEKGGYENVEFRMGEIENLPVEDDSVDVIISNCVINLVPNKLRAFQEAFRVLKPGGRLMISDMVLQKELPEFIKTSIEAYAGCIAGAIKKDEYLDAIKEAGFTQMKIIKDVVFNMNYIINFPELRFILKNNPDALELLENDSELLNNMVASIDVRAFKPL